MKNPQIVAIKKHLALVVCCFAVFVSYAQTSDLARIEYTYIPQTNSDNSINRFRAFINFPIELGWDGHYLIPGVEYRNFDLDIKDPVPFDINELGKFQLFRASVGYTFKLKNNWRFGAKVGAEVASNFSENKILNGDVNFTGAILMIKDKTGDGFEKPSRLLIGLNYSTNAGRPFPLPILNYYKEFHPKWSYSVGSPKTNLKYSVNDKNILQAFISLDGFYSNIQNDREVFEADGTARPASNISMTSVLGGLGYEYAFTKHLRYYGYVGHTFYHEIRLRDSDRNTLYRLNDENTFYIRTGIKFKF
ncbi:DUF6268 family outer membrane beta-barrel protein [Ulvibacter litoralis]|uniref:DUF6268 domain-containing protein n=1 Tax=Ulvibacter litoralis TaxID=227084 RepID=A0A1G7GRM8_9FLAO|nr:DUF6268 family outer membrane beta-barrel protein [Ulvibacter litoralis]GHC55305.1 hypothetical protein GCM10008083_19270 [Ulvibacter litoralis]SDE90805.1 hypothetical protein SAMN05421855_103297 [Ulvibacter litoralis]